MRNCRVRRLTGGAAVFVGVGALLVQFAPAASATKPLSAPVFSSKATVTGKQGKPLSFTVKTKANPTADVAVVSPLPPGVTFTDNHNGTATLSDPTPLAGSYSIGLQATNTTSQANTTDQTVSFTVTSKLPLIRHVFVIMLENQDYSATFGSPTVDPYLAHTLPSQGALLTNYYGIGHFSNDNYAGFISGQPPNSANQLDCLGSGYTDILGGFDEIAGIQQGAGCVFPSGVTTLANQLDADGLTWKGYQ